MVAGVRTLVLALEQVVQLLFEVFAAAVLFRRLERIHRWPVVFSEGVNQLRRRRGKAEGIGVSDKRDLVLRDAGGAESLDHVALDPPGHRAHEALGRGRRVGRADLQDLRHQGRIVRNPVPHDDPAAGPRHAGHFLGDVERLRREHRPEDADDEIERVVLEIAQVGGVAFLKLAIREALGLGAPVAGLDKVGGDIDPEHIRAQSRFRQRGRSVAAAEIEDLHALRDAEFLDQLLPAFSHAFRDAGEVALFPKRFVRIHAFPPGPPARSDRCASQTAAYSRSRRSGSIERDYDFAAGRRGLSPARASQASIRLMNQFRIRVQISSLPIRSSTPCSRFGLSLTSMTTIAPSVSLMSTP